MCSLPLVPDLSSWLVQCRFSETLFLWGNMCVEGLAGLILRVLELQGLENLTRKTVKWTFYQQACSICFYLVSQQSLITFFSFIYTGKNTFEILNLKETDVAFKTNSCEIIFLYHLKILCEGLWLQRIESVELTWVAGRVCAAWCWPHADSRLQFLPWLLQR